MQIKQEKRGYNLYINIKAYVSLKGGKNGRYTNYRNSNCISSFLMFVFPLMTMSDRTDDVSQLAVETATTDFVDDIRTTGKLSMDKYSKFYKILLQQEIHMM